MTLFASLVSARKLAEKPKGNHLLMLHVEISRETLFWFPQSLVFGGLSNDDLDRELGINDLGVDLTFRRLMRRGEDSRDFR